jgi:putative tryptophan/tyrosine transport system substrate-binding protein
MKRRELITLLGGAAAAWPLAARAQQPAPKLRRIGVLMSQTADDPDALSRIAAFAQGLQELGWTIGGNMRMDTRWGGGDLDRFRRYAAELVALSPDVIVATAGSIVGALQQASRTVPIVFVTTIDPVGGGFVASLARPGGNATGFTTSEYQHVRETAGAAQRDRARRDSRSRHPGPLGTCWSRWVCRYPNRGAIVSRGVNPSRRARWRRNRSR